MFKGINPNGLSFVVGDGPPVEPAVAPLGHGSRTPASGKLGRRLKQLRIFGRMTSMLLGAAALPAVAQEVESGDAPPPVAADPANPQARQVYTAEDFARFAPKTALDMVAQVPGFQIRDNGQGRGLGQANDNVLVNGERLASKSDSVRDQLARIPASDVIRIEIVDGASLDIPGLSGQVANIVVRASSGLTGQFQWNPVFRAHYAHPSLLGGEVSVKGNSGPVEYTVALSNDAGRGAAGGPTDIFDPTGALIEARETVLAIDNERPKLALGLKYDGPGDDVGNLNLSFRKPYFDLEDDEIRVRPGGVDRNRTLRARERGYDYEISADYEFALGPGRLKLIGLERFDHERFSETAVFAFADGRPDVGSRYVQELDSGERIARAEYGWKLAGDWQLALEGAFNRLDKQAALFDLDPAGEFVEVPFPGGDGGVTEDRYEAILSYGRPLTPKLTMQLSAGGEYSKIRQTGVAAAERQFVRPKGSVNLAWAPGAGLDISLKVERRVGQLDFGDFLARVFLDQGNQNATNADLVPEQSWDTDLTIKKSLGAWGSTNLRLFNRETEDIVATVPLPGGVEGRGNIDKLNRHGLEWTSTLRFDPVGFKGGKLDLNLIWQDSQLADPLTGRLRQLDFLTTLLVEADLRHDVPNSDWAWGAGAFYARREPYFRLREFGLDREGPVFLDLFVEHKDVFGLTVNARLGNVLNARRKLDRTVFAGPRDTSPILFVERRDQLIGPLFRFTVKGSF